MPDHSSDAKENAKQLAGEKAAHFVEEGMKIGIGTGSTTYYFTRALGKRCRSGLKIQAIATSEATRKLAIAEKIPLTDNETLDALDLTVDGADQIDPQYAMIKGGGGALAREKITATMSQKVLIIVDESKCVEKLGGSVPMPMELLPYGCEATITHLKKLGYHGTMRKSREGSLYRTDNGNYIYDTEIEGIGKGPKAMHAEIIAIPGVVETGLFFDIPGRLIVGSFNGSIKITDMNHAV